MSANQKQQQYEQFVTKVSNKISDEFEKEQMEYLQFWLRFYKLLNSGKQQGSIDEYYFNYQEMIDLMLENISKYGKDQFYMRIYSVLVIYYGESQLYKIGVESIMDQMEEMDYDVKLYFKQKPHNLNHLLFYYLELSDFEQIEKIQNELENDYAFQSSASYIHTKLHVLTEFEQLQQSIELCSKYEHEIQDMEELFMKTHIYWHLAVLMVDQKPNKQQEIDSDLYEIQKRFIRFDSRENQLNVLLYLIKLYVRGYDIEPIEKQIQQYLEYNYVQTNLQRLLNVFFMSRADLIDQKDIEHYCQIHQQNKQNMYNCQEFKVKGYNDLLFMMFRLGKQEVEQAFTYIHNSTIDYVVCLGNSREQRQIIYELMLLIVYQLNQFDKLDFNIEQLIGKETKNSFKNCIKKTYELGMI